MSEDLHRRFGIELNNATWNVLAGGGLDEDATDGDREHLLYCAYASAFHWMEATGSKPANRVRGEHLVARAAIASGRPDAALIHARRCLELCELHAEDIQDWDLAFAEEAMARALASAGDVAAAREHLERAMELGNAIVDDDDREVFLDELGREPWFSLDPSGS